MGGKNQILQPAEGVNSGCTPHVCPDCGSIHEVVPTCRLCDDTIQIRRHWYQTGFEQGRRETIFELTGRRV